jgi:hypothetical protein
LGSKIVVILNKFYEYKKCALERATSNLGRLRV